MIRDGLLTLSKDPSVRSSPKFFVSCIERHSTSTWQKSSSAHTISAPLASLIALRGPEHLDPDTPSLPRSAGRTPQARQAQPRSYTTSPALSPFVPSSSFTSDSEFNLSQHTKEHDRTRMRDRVRGGAGPPPSPYIVCAKFRIQHPSSNTSHSLSHAGPGVAASSHDHSSGTAWLLEHHWTIHLSFVISHFDCVRCSWSWLHIS